MPRTLSFVCLFVIGLFHSLASAQTPCQPAQKPIVVLTFDDSVKSHFTIARPILKEYGFGATFFITEGFTFTTNKRIYMRFLKSEGCTVIAMRDLSKYVNPYCVPCDPWYGIKARQQQLAAEGETTKETD
jgi:hypothetical protein